MIKMIKIMKKSKFLSLILMASALLIMVTIYPNISNVKAETQSGVYVYTSCGGTISANGTSLTGGTTYNYTSGSSVTFTATPISTCNFLCWEYASSSGAQISTTNPLVYTVPSIESAVQALFIPKVNTTLTQSSSGTGTAPFDVPISIGGTTTPAAATYTNYTIGSVVDFTANAQSGFKFLYWLVPAATSDAVNIVTSSTLAFKVTSSACAIQAFFIPTSSSVTLPAITTVSEFSAGAALIVAIALVIVAFATYAFRKKAELGAPYDSGRC